MEIPAALIGAQHKEIIERLAPVLGATPVNMLRAALAAGLTGGRPVTEECVSLPAKPQGSQSLCMIPEMNVIWHAPLASQ
jgi:hypothetical protein